MSVFAGGGGRGGWGGGELPLAPLSDVYEQSTVWVSAVTRGAPKGAHLVQCNYWARGRTRDPYFVTLVKLANTSFS